MSSGLLYLAIVGVWALVLVPMWLRGHDTGERSVARLLSRRPRFTSGPSRRPPPPDGGLPGGGSAEPEEYAEHVRAVRVGPGADTAGPPAAARPTVPSGAPAAAASGQAPAASGQAPTASGRPRGPTRARVIARRRRRLFGISLLFVTAVVLASSRLAPFWVIAPPAVLLVAYLAVLRAAGQIDAERRQALAARGTPAARPTAGTDRAYDASPGGAVVIALASDPAGADEPYDQYADAGLRAVGD